MLRSATEYAEGGGVGIQLDNNIFLPRDLALFTCEILKLFQARYFYLVRNFTTKHCTSTIILCCRSDIYYSIFECFW